MRVAICDDEKIERDRIEELICQYSVEHNIDIYIDCYENGEELLQSYEKGKYDMIFLDVEMGEMDGIEIAHKIRNYPDHNVSIIYATSYPEYMQQGFDVRAAQFFTKPVKYDAFEKTVNNVLEYMKADREQIVVFNNAGEQIIIPLSDICTIEADKYSKKRRRLIINTVTGQLEAGGVLKEYSDLYGDVLVYAHRSILINVENVFKWSGTDCEMKNGKKVAISRKRLTEVKDMFSKVILRKVGR